MSRLSLKCSNPLDWLTFPNVEPLLRQNSNITGFFPDRILRSFGGFNVLSFTISAGTGDKPRMDVTASKPLVVRSGHYMS